MIDSLSREQSRQQNAVAYFYCDYADSETLDASIIFGTIIQQLLIGRPSIAKEIAAKIREAYSDGIRRASPQDLINILEFIVLYYCHYMYIVLDGVDETSPDIQDNLFSSLAKLSISCSPFLRLYISTREITLIPHHFPSCLRFDVSESRGSEDIDHYVKESVQQRLHSLPVMISYPYLERSVVQELTTKAHGL